MENKHDAVRPMFLLGAGSSIPAGLPDAYQLTQLIWNRLHNDPSFSGAFWLFGKIHSLLVESNLRNGKANPGHVDAEAIFRCLQILSDRRSGLPSYYRELPDLDHLVAGWKPDIDYPNYAHKAMVWINRQLYEIFGITDNDASRWSHLNHLTTFWSKNEPGQHRYPLVIATLNYDNLIERFAEANSIHLKDFVSSTPSFKATANRRIFLLKLHGSVTWQLDLGPSFDYAHKMFLCPLVRGMALDELSTLINTVKNHEPGPIGSDGDPFLDAPFIFGNVHKLLYIHPFPQLYAQFLRWLPKHNHIITIGYSFRDTHINQRIVEWMMGDDENRLTIINKSETKMEDQDALAKNLPPQFTNLCASIETKLERIAVDPRGTEVGLRELADNGFRWRSLP